MAHYQAVARAAAGSVIQGYSTSFSLATRLLRPAVRRDIEALYAMVRIADEIVDGAAAQAGLDPRVAVEDYRRVVLSAIDTPFHADPVACAFGHVVRSNGIPTAQVEAFFDSMRMDTEVTTHDEASYSRYIYGSAEVIGLMCLRVFLRGKEGTHKQQTGARALGSAFQKINFLRDFREDSLVRGRCYLPGVKKELDDATKHRVLAEIDQELAIAREVARTLPFDATVAVGVATALFQELAEIIRRTSATEIMRRRVSVPPRRKAVLVARMGGVRWLR